VGSEKGGPHAATTTAQSQQLDKTVTGGSQTGSPTAGDSTNPDAVVPTVKLSGDNDLIDAGGSVTLIWSSENADNCNASGGWSGSKGTSGQETIGGLQDSQTFSLNCAGAGGSAVAMVSVSVVGSLQISWQAPTENVDGTPINGLSAYRIHYGESSGQYDSVVEVDGSASDHTLNLIVGEYYIAMTAVDVDGDESGLSNEVVKRAI